MTGRRPELVHVVGQIRAGDPVAATARSLQHRLTRLGHSGSLHRADALRSVPATDERLLVHSVDGGGTLGPALDAAEGRRITLIHHGSAPGTDRRVLRQMLRFTDRAVAAAPSAREELRGLGYAQVGLLSPGVVADAFDDVVPDPATAADLPRHPGPRLLAVGPIVPGRGLEGLVTAFAELVTMAAPAAVLSLCGPADPAYRRRIDRLVASQGLVACEVVEPASEEEVLARLDQASVVISLTPAALDPYLWCAAARGCSVIAPRHPATAHLDGTLVAVPWHGGPQLASAMAAALQRATQPTTSNEVRGPAASDTDLLATLGLT